MVTDIAIDKCIESLAERADILMSWDSEIEKDKTRSHSHFGDMFMSPSAIFKNF